MVGVVFLFTFSTTDGEGRYHFTTRGTTRVTAELEGPSWRPFVQGALLVLGELGLYLFTMGEPRRSLRGAIFLVGAL